MKNKKLWNLGKIINFTFRRERLNILLWILGLSLFSFGIAFGMQNIFDAQSRESLILLIDQPGMRAINGPVFGADNYTIGAMYSSTMFIWMTMAFASMNIFIAINNSRRDEEDGLYELLYSKPLGRLSKIVSTSIVLLIVNILIAIIIGFGLYALKLEGMDLKSSLSYSFGNAAFGFLFAAIALLMAEIFTNSRKAIVYSFYIMGLFYLIRAIGDVQENILSYISPMGLVLRVQPFVENNIFIILILLIQALAILLIVFCLNSRRDMGTGLVQDKSGKSKAGFLLKSNFGFILKISLSTLLIWTMTIFIFGAAYGTVIGDIDKFVADNEFYKEIMRVNEQYDISTMYISMVINIMTVFSIIPLINLILQLEGEEKKRRLDLLLSNPISRTRTIIYYIVLVFLFSLVLQLIGVLGIYLIGNFVLSESIDLVETIKTSMVYLPAMWFIISITTFLLGVSTKFTKIVWAYLGYSFMITFTESFIDYPEIVNKLSIFNYIPKLPIDNINMMNLSIISVIALIVTAIGVLLYRRRDLV